MWGAGERVGCEGAAWGAGKWMAVARGACEWVVWGAHERGVWGAGAGAAGGAEERVQGGAGQPGLHNPAASRAGPGQPPE